MTSELQDSNAEFSIFVTPSGILMLVSELQLAKALSPIFVTLFGILILVSDLQYEFLYSIDS